MRTNIYTKKAWMQHNKISNQSGSYDAFENDKKIKIIRLSKDIKKLTFEILDTI